MMPPAKKTSPDALMPPANERVNTGASGSIETTRDLRSGQYATDIPRTILFVYTPDPAGISTRTIGSPVFS
ncbi:MAG: hypothetical protein PHF57_03245 [Methanoregula sp.]|nr:hypothetical protein [Methanoregula sp.]